VTPYHTSSKCPRCRLRSYVSHKEILDRWERLERLWGRALTRDELKKYVGRVDRNSCYHYSTEPVEEE
jgi:hypothetical protein